MILRSMSSLIVAGAIAAPLLVLVPVPGFGQIDEIMVTTRKREESLQAVPIAVTAITAEQIARQGISNLSDVSSLDPSVQFDTVYGPADTRITIRGLSNTRGRSNVAFLIDNIDVTTENLNAAGSGLLANRRLLADVQRIEVVKGPQSALYGRAAFAGAINYVTKDPGDQFEASASMELGDYGRQEFGLLVSGPVIDGILGMRLSSIWYSSDGYYVNSLSGEPVGDADGEGFALTTVYTPTDELRFKLRGEYSKEDAGPRPNVRVGGGTQGYNMQLFEYPQAALDAGLGRNTQFFNPASLSTFTALINFGQYCPEELKDPARGPGFCLPTTYGSGRGKVVTQSEDPRTDRDFVGTSVETFRLALETTLDAGVGTLTAYTGYTDFEGSDTYDQDWQAMGRPDTLLGIQSSDSLTETKQFSNELRFASQLDGPVQFTLGTLWWTETRDFYDSSVIIFCTLTRRTSTAEGTQDLEQAPNLYCSGEDGTLDNWQQYYRNLQPQIGAPWKAETDHWSFYATLDWSITDTVKLSLENRYISETFNFSKPNQSSCTQFFGPNPAPLPMTDNPDVRCSVQDVLDPDFDLLPLPPALTGTQGYRINRGSTRSQFSTPKATLQWQATDDAQLYFSWAKAQKPGGVATTPGGGAPVNFDEDRFLAEKMTAWELGAKTDWELAGQLRLNSSLFYLDYSDKQVGTQILQDGFLAPRVVNAASADVKGLELDVLWAPDLVAGLTLRAAYTYLQAEYDNFLDETTNLLRIAQLGQGCAVVFKDGLGPNPPGDPPKPDPFCQLDLSGKQLERTPKHAFVAGVTVVRPFLETDYDYVVDLNTNYQSKRYLDQDNTLYFEEHWLTDVSAGLQGERLDVLFYVENVFNDRTIKTGGFGPDFGNQVLELGFLAGLGVNNYFGTLPDPRVFGIRASYRFGGL